MNKYQYKENDYALELLDKGFTSKYISSELKILAKYYKSQNKDESKTKLLLQEFCEKNLKGYNDAIHFKIINSAVKFGMSEKNKLIQIDSIEITQNELHQLEKMDIDYDYKRVVFTLLVLTKLSKKFLVVRDGNLKNNEFYFGGHKNFRELVSVSKIKFNKTKKSKVKNIHDLIHVLDEKKIVEITGNGNIKLLFMYGINEDDNVAFSVDNYMNIGFYYDSYYGENRVKECESCGTLFKTKSNRQEYCDTCGKEKELEKYRKYNDKRN